MENFVFDISTISWLSTGSTTKRMQRVL